MHSLSSGTRALLALTALLMLIVAPSAPAHAVETANSEFVIIRPGDVVEDDLYAAAVKVSVEGEIRGDLIAVAAEEVVIDGTVTGSVLAFAPRVVINGVVEGSLRTTTPSLLVNGTVSQDVVAPSFSVRLSSESSVGGDVLVWAVDADFRGSIGEDLTGSMRELSLAGAVEGDVDVNVGTLSVVGPLTVVGDLGYRSDRSGSGLDRVSVGGVLVEKEPLPPNLRIRALAVFGRFLAILFLTIATLTTAWGWPVRTSAAIERLAVGPVRSWGWGALVIFSPLLLAALGALVLILAPPQAGLPLLVLLIPLFLAMTGLVLALCLVAGVPVVGLLGRKLFPRRDFYTGLLLGSGLLGLLWLIPWLGWLVPLLVLPLGLGAWLDSWRSRSGDLAELSSSQASG